MNLRTSISYILLLGILPFFNIFKVHSQVPTINLFTIEDGLSQTSVNCLIQDSKGFLWIGTQDGLNKYDGYTFRIFRNNPADTTSLSNNFINCIYEGANGNIWVGTNYGLNMYNIHTEEFIRYYHDPGDINSLKEDEIYDIYEDKSGYVWIKTENYLTRLNPRSNKFRHYEHYNDVFNFLSVNAKFSIFEDHKGQLWVGTKDGLNYFDRKLEIFKRYKHDPNDNSSLSNNKVKVIYEDSDHNLWIGTERGLNKFNWETETFTRFYYQENNPKSISNDIINDIFEDNEGNIWIATELGLNKLDKKTENFTVYNRFMHNNDVILATSFTDIFQDHTGIMWAGTLQGLIKIENKRKSFKLYRTSKDGKPLFANNYVTAIFEKEHTVWVGTYGAGLYLFNPKSKRSVKLNTENSSIANNYIHKIYEDYDKNIWIGTQNGISFYNTNHNRFEDVDRLKSLNVFKNNRIFDIVQDQQKDLWIASKFGLHHLQQDTVISYVHSQGDSTTIAANLVYDILFDTDNNLWIATEKGLSYLNTRSKKIKNYIRPGGVCDNCLSSNEVLSLHIDTLRDYLWIGTNDGLNRFDLTDKVFKSYSTEDGLANNLIYAMLDDNSGDLWMSTNMGISKMHVDEESFSNFGVSDGLQDFEFNHGSAYKAEDGELFFGGIAGYNSFYPDSIVKNDIVPNIEITAVEVLSDKSSKRIPLGVDRTIELSHRNNLVTIEFSALDFTDPLKNNYAYKLEGVEDEWINLGNRRYATFSNLSPGKYTFHVKGSNSDQVWNEEGAALKIIIDTPVWETRFAYAFYILLLSGLIVWIFRYRTRSLRKSNQELKEKELIAKQIAKQKEELTIKNKSITDSIVYAKRIQEALMPTMQYFKGILPESFILYKPKDIVSGDFYWINERNNKIFVAVVDCTGHGVPGAFMSIIGFELLRNITDEQGIEDPDQILKQLNNGVANTFGKSAEKARIKDGMDIALCVIDKAEAKLEFSGAFRPLYMIRNNKIEEIRGDRFSVGLLNEGENDEISKRTIKLEKNDIFYIFSDGYADQFGGPEGKKYKYRRFRHLLLTIHKLPLDQQLTYFDRSFEDWKGEHEQVDDVLILGFRPVLE